jgi:hypothetical protein
MGAAAIAAAAGLVLGTGGTFLSANAASKARKALSSTTGDWLPNINQYQEQYFQDLQRFEAEASDLSTRIGERSLNDALALREKMFPGLGGAIKDSTSGIYALMRGDLPKSVMDSFSRAGGASTVGSGFGGSGFGFLNTGLFGARGSIGAMETGYGLLGALLATSPQLQTPSAMTFLQNLMTPEQRTNTQLTVRGQNLDIASKVAGMPTRSQVWGNWLGGIGGQLMGAGLSAGLGGGGGGGGGGTFGWGPAK